ncbi:unnamed protein product, partial [Polarella glacialis]
MWEACSNRPTRFKLAATGSQVQGAQQQFRATCLRCPSCIISSGCFCSDGRMQSSLKQSLFKAWLPSPTSSQPWSKNRRPRSCVCRQVACLATTTTAAAGQSAETLLGAMSGVKLPLLAADVAGHDVAPLGCSLSLRQGQDQARLAARGSFLANLAVEVTLQQTG